MWLSPECEVVRIHRTSQMCTHLNVFKKKCVLLKYVFEMRVLPGSSKDETDSDDN